MVRKSPILDSLISRTKQEILTATLLQPDRSWYLVELARHLRMRPSSLQRDLRQLAAAGLLRRRANGNRVYFQADISSPVFSELSQILFKTTGLVEALQNALAPLDDQIEIAFIYGSMATSAETSASDIDLMVVGAAPLSRLAPPLREVERRLGRPINPTIYTDEEFVRRLIADNHFLKSVLQTKPLYIKGGPDELATLAARAEGKAASHKPSGNRRSAKRR